MRTRLLKGAALLAVLAVLVGVALWIVPVFKVRDISVVGAVNTAPEDVVAQSAIPLGANVLRVDTHAAAERVVELPWVRRATVRRDLLFGIDISVDERVPVLFAVRPDGDHLIDANGVPFILAPPPASSIEVIDTPADDVPTFRGAADIVASLDPQLRGMVARISARSPYEYVVMLLDGREIYWGAAEDNAEKAMAAQVALTQDGQVFNVSDPEQVTVRM